jgi:hypothetical protein
MEFSTGICCGQFYYSAGTATQATVAVSKDNVLFGVRSVNRAGQSSPAAFAFPARSPAPPPKK